MYVNHTLNSVASNLIVCLIQWSPPPGFSLTQDLQGSGECQFSSSPEESIFFQVNSFDRSLSQMSSVYTET